MAVLLNGSRASEGGAGRQPDGRAAGAQNLTPDAYVKGKSVVLPLDGATKQLQDDSRTFDESDTPFTPTRRLR
ncbi:hypothetical protein ACWCY6_27445 [Streptomyces sp. 900105755]